MFEMPECLTLAKQMNTSIKGKGIVGGNLGNSTVTTQMWGGMELFDDGDEQEREYIKGMKMTPADPRFTLDYFNSLIESLVPEKKRSVRGLLTQEQIIPGLGNAIAQDIMFKARLHPRHAIQEMDDNQKRMLYRATMETVQGIVDLGGRYDEFDLFGQRGGYVRIMDKNSAGQPYPNCGTLVQKIQYLGGDCHLCPSCQI
jgi:formamidopyrimidine-DNA glycosylase